MEDIFLGPDKPYVAIVQYENVNFVNSFYFCKFSKFIFHAIYIIFHILVKSSASYFDNNCFPLFPNTEK